MIANNGACKEETRRRLIVAKAVTIKLTKFLKGTVITGINELQLVDPTIFSAYTAKNWTITKADAKRIYPDAASYLPIYPEKCKH